MQNFHDFNEFNTSELSSINDLIASAWAEARPESGGEARLPVRCITVAEVLRGYVCPRPETLDSAAADAAAQKLVRVLAKRGVVLEGARWLGGRAYYAWLLNEFLPRPVRSDISRDEPATFRFTELAPQSVDNLFRSVERFVAELTELDALPDAQWLTARGCAARRLTDDRARYLRAWQGSFLSADVQRLRPTAVHDHLVSDGVRLDFQIEYRVRFEDHSTRAFAGAGRAELFLDGNTWRIAELRFPGFSLR